MSSLLTSTVDACVHSQSFVYQINTMVEQLICMCITIKLIFLNWIKKQNTNTAQKSITHFSKEQTLTV